MNQRFPGKPAGRSGAVRWRHSVRRAALRTGCLLGAAGLLTVFSIVLSVPLAPGDTGSMLVASAQAAGDGQGDNGQENNGGGRNGDDRDNDQGDDNDQGSNGDRGDDGQGNNNDEDSDGADGAGVSTEGKGQDGGARAKGDSRGGRRGGAHSARGGHGVADSRSDFGKLDGIVDDDFEDGVDTGRAAPVREALHATVLSTDEEAAAIAAGWMPID